MRAGTVSDLKVMIDRDDIADFQPPSKQATVAEKENQHTSKSSVKLHGEASWLPKK